MTIDLNMKCSLSSILLLFIILIIISSEVVDSARKGSGRRGRKQRRKQNSARLIGLSPKLKAYYENENVSKPRPVV